MTLDTWNPQNCRGSPSLRFHDSTRGRGWSFGGGIRATDEVFINAANTIKSPGYFLADGLVEYAVNRNLSLRLNLTNLTDNVYIRNVNNNGGRYNPGQPRAAILTSNVTF